jgi:alanine racemase
VADSSDRTYTEEQITRFSQCIEGIRDVGIDPGIVHAANSAAMETFPGSWFDMIRPGMAAYGYSQADESARVLKLKPVMELKSRIVFIKRAAAGTPLSYGHTYFTAGETTIATVSAGYADGYRRALSNHGEVLIRGKRFPVVGTVCMDQFLVDLGDRTDVKVFDEVTLFGPDPSGPDAAELAALIGTIPYEITCGVSSRIPRTTID